MPNEVVKFPSLKRVSYPFNSIHSPHNDFIWPWSQTTCTAFSCSWHKIIQLIYLLAHETNDTSKYKSTQVIPVADYSNYHSLCESDSKELRRFVFIQLISVSNENVKWVYCSCICSYTLLCTQTLRTSFPTWQTLFAYSRWRFNHNSLKNDLLKTPTATSGR